MTNHIVDANKMVPPPHLLKKFSEQARVDSKKRGHSGYCKTFAKLCIDWALNSQPNAALAQPEPQGPSRPAIEPVPKQEDIHYAWELHDAEGDWQAGGSANSLEDVQREGNRYLQTYSQDGPHKLIIERHCVTTIEPVPGVEGDNG